MIYKYVLFFSILILFSCKEKRETTSPTIEKITESIYASGYVKSKDQYQVFAKSNGLLKKINIKEGDIVKKGQILFSLSNEVSKLNSDNALLVASNSEVNANQDRIRELQLTVENTKKKLDNDRLMLERQRKLWAQQIGTRVELEQRELGYNNSKSIYESAILRLAELRKQINFNAAQSKKNLSISRSMQSDYNVRSEVNGKVYSIVKEEGEMVTSQTPLAIIGNANTYKVILDVDENDIVNITPGLKILVTMDSYKGELFEAVIEKINPIMKEKSRTFEVEALFTKQPPTLYPNLTVEANIILQTKENALTIPRKYILDNEYVLISKKEKTKVKIGLKDYQKAEIIEGITKDQILFLPE